MISTFNHGSITVNMNTQWLRYSNSIGYLNHCPLTKSICNQILCNPSSSIRSWSIHFWRVFPRESTSSMSSPTTICISNNFSPCKSSVTGWSSNNKVTTWVQNVASFLEKIFFNGVLDYMLDKILLDGGRICIFFMLAGDENSGHSNRHHIIILFFVLDGHLNLSIRSHPLNYFFLPTFFQSSN